MISGIDQRTLMHMRADGLGWLAGIVESMYGGDPWQEGAFAREICEEYRENRPAA